MASPIQDDLRQFLSLLKSKGVVFTITDDVLVELGATSLELFQAHFRLMNDAKLTEVLGITKPAHLSMLRTQLGMLPLLPFYFLFCNSLTHLCFVYLCHSRCSCPSSPRCVSSPRQPLSCRIVCVTEYVIRPLCFQFWCDSVIRDGGATSILW